MKPYKPYVPDSRNKEKIKVLRLKLGVLTALCILLGGLLYLLVIAPGTPSSRIEKSKIEQRIADSIYFAPKDSLDCLRCHERHEIF